MSPYWGAARRLCGVVALAVALAISTTSAGAEGPTDDRLAIDFDATTLNGAPFHGFDLKGRIVLLDVWAVWCRPCIDAFPTLNTLAREFAGRNVEVIGVAVHSGTRDEVAAFLEGYDIDYRMVVAADDVAYHLDVIGFPTYLLVGTDGAIYQRYVGDLESLTDRLARDVQLLESPSAP